MAFDHPAAHEGKTPAQLVEDLGAELAVFGRRLQDLGRRLEARPERVTYNELVGLVTELGHCITVQGLYREALVTSWRLEFPPAREEYG